MLSLPYERSEVEYLSARQTTGAWQYVRLFRHFLNRNYYQVWAGHVPQGRQPYSPQVPDRTEP